MTLWEISHFTEVCDFGVCKLLITAFDGIGGEGFVASAKAVRHFQVVNASIVPALNT